MCDIHGGSLSSALLDQPWSSDWFHPCAADIPLGIAASDHADGTHEAAAGSISFVLFDRGALGEVGRCRLCRLPPGKDPVSRLLERLCGPQRSRGRSVVGSGLLSQAVVKRAIPLRQKPPTSNEHERNRYPHPAGCQHSAHQTYQANQGLHCQGMEARLTARMPASGDPPSLRHA